MYVSIKYLLNAWNILLEGVSCIFIFIFCANHNLGCVQTISVVGPVFGYLLGSLCAKIYVDIGFVKMGEFKKVLIPFCKIYTVCCLCCCVFPSFL